jgi:hypothetical protein
MEFRITRKHDVSETGPLYVRGERKEMPTLLGPLERANLNHWTSGSPVVENTSSFSEVVLLASANLWSESLDTDPEILGSILGTTTFYET